MPDKITIEQPDCVVRLRTSEAAPHSHYNLIWYSGHPLFFSDGCVPALEMAERALALPIARRKGNATCTVIMDGSVLTADDCIDLKVPNRRVTVLVSYEGGPLPQQLCALGPQDCAAGG